MAEPHLDHPGDVSWFHGYGPATVIGPCPHADCEHQDARSIAWGPDWEHYILEECLYCRCRGWFAEWVDEDGRRHYRPSKRWLEVEQPVLVTR